MKLETLSTDQLKIYMQGYKDGIRDVVLDNTKVKDNIMHEDDASALTGYKG